jgi:hypothetical protein
MSRRRPVERVPLLLWAAALAALVVGAIVAAAETDSDWAVALACVALVATAMAMAVVTRSFLLDEEDVDPATPRASARRHALGLAVIAAAAIAIAFLGSRHDDVGAATTSGTSGAAEETVREFLVAAYVDDDGESACGYLAQNEQRQVAVTDRTTSCRNALNDAGGPPEMERARSHAAAVAAG